MGTSRTVILCALIALPGLASAATFRVGTGAGCTHATIQDAIDAAAADPDVADFIRVTRSATYDNVALDIHDQHVVLLGGYVNCLDEVGDGQRTVLNGDGDHSVVRIHGDGDVVLRYLTLSGGHEPLFDYGYGGGIQIYGGPHLVTVDHLFVTNNEAGHGGGISLRNDVSGDPNQNKLVLGDDVVISFNHAEYTPGAYSSVQGGGIFCFESSVQMVGGGTTTVTANSASLDGGGIGAIECDLEIAPHGTYGSFNGVVLNDAGRDGGGILTEGGSGIGTRLYVTDANRPVYVSGNSAAREGGGIKINTGATVAAWDLIIDGNRSLAEGGGVSMSDGGSDDSTNFYMLSATDTVLPPPPGAVNCAAALRCNSLSENIARDASNQPQSAAALRTRIDPPFGAYGAAYAYLRGTRIADNAGKTLMRVLEPPDFGDVGESWISTRSVSMVGNEVSDTLLETGTSATNGFGNAFYLVDATIAGNLIDGAAVIRSHHNIQLVQSIVWQPGRQVLNLTDGTLDADAIIYDLLSDMDDIPSSPTNFIADPRFMDPEQGDYHLHASSPAIDYLQDGSGVDEDDQTRTVNLALVPDDAFGPRDLGAYERQSIGNLVRNAAFDDDLHIWTDVTPGSSSWSPEDRSGSTSSGSIEIIDDSPAMRVTALTQCVGVPGPALYRLSGWGYVSANHNIGDRPIVAWWYFPNSADCSGAAVDLGETAVADVTTGWHPIGGQYIAVSPAEWTPNTSVLVALVLEKGDDPLFPENGFGRFDDITLVADSDVIFADGFDP